MQHRTLFFFYLRHSAKLCVSNVSTVETSMTKQAPWSTTYSESEGCTIRIRIIQLNANTVHQSFMYASKVSVPSHHLVLTQKSFVRYCQVPAV